MKINILKPTPLLTAVGTLFALIATPASAWFGGSCADHYANGGCGVCVEVFDGNCWWHVNGPDGEHSDPTWKGALPTSGECPAYGEESSASESPFIFSGATDLACVGLNAACTLTLEGLLKKEDGSLGVQIVDGSVAGSGLCSLIEMDFPWWAGPDSQHSGHGAGSSIPIGTPPYEGSVGNIAFRVRNPLFIPPYLVNISDAHIHGVTFTNETGASCFTFSNDILYSDESSTGCSIDGKLCVQNGKDVNVYNQTCL